MTMDENSIRLNDTCKQQPRVKVLMYLYAYVLLLDFIVYLNCINDEKMQYQIF